jgi:hypothetical protein
MPIENCCQAFKVPIFKNKFCSETWSMAVHINGPSRLYSFLSVVTLLARSHRLSWENLPAVVSHCLPPCTILFILIGPLEPSSSRSGDLGEKLPLNFAYETSLCPSGSFTCRKLRQGFLSHLKIHLPRPGLNPRTLGPVASTLTTSPPRQIHKWYSKIKTTSDMNKTSSTLPCRGNHSHTHIHTHTNRVLTSIL